MRKKLLISITSQFGYHTDTYMYCKYLDPTKYEVHYVGFEIGLARRMLDHVQVHYIQVHPNKIKRYWIYLNYINKLIRKEKFDILFLVDCQASLLIRLCNLFQKTILDIRTGDVNLKKGKLSFFNIKIWFSALSYKHVSIISNNLRKRLMLPSKKCHLLPLGAEPLDLPEKSFDYLTLFYIGTLQNRNIQQTVEGLSIFLSRNTLDFPIQYHIVGFGKPEEKILLDCINSNHLDNIVWFHGRKNHDEVFDLFQKSNVGIVYIPITKGYTCQPTTKLFEHLLAGMPVIATKTIENELEVKQTDGVLIQDTPEAFAQGLEEFVLYKNTYNSGMLKQKFKMHSWENIVKQNLEPYLNKIWKN